MGKYSIASLAFILTVAIACNSKTKQQATLSEIKELKDYPSASGIEYLNDKVYVIGDDANGLLILDSNLTSIDSITLYPFTEKRISKNVKADLEGITITKEQKLLVTGSGSLAPYRNIAWMVDPLTKQKEIILLDSFYNRLKQHNISEVNIEGICTIPGSITLTNRGNKSYPTNHLVITSNDFWNDPANAPVSVILMDVKTDSSSFSGVSGISYAAKNDLLILTVSTEDTRNSIDDGAIGKSYLWIIKNISTKIKSKTISPDTVIDLDAIDLRFKGHKIESVCIMNESKTSYQLLLAADNDNGSSTLFKLTIPNK